MKCAIFEEHSSSCVVYFRSSGTLFPVSMIDGVYTFTINWVTTGARKMPFEYMFCFILSKQCIKIISSPKKCGLFSSVL